MRSFQIVRLSGFVAALLSLSACYTAPPTKQEAADWYGMYAPLVRWVGYQGSDERFHYFIARVMDSWKFIRIGRDELVVDDPRPYSTASSAPLYHYLVDPSRDYTKIKSEGEPSVRANRLPRR